MQLPLSSKGSFRTLLLGLCTCITVGVFISVGLSKTSHAAPDPWKPYPILESCTRADQQYASMFFNIYRIDDWAQAYHERVDGIIEEYLKPPEKIDCLNPVILPLNPVSALSSLASELPPWQNPAELANLDRNDYGIVLLEYLRLYECAMADHNLFLPMDVIRERFEDDAGGGPLATYINGFVFESLLKEMKRRQRIIVEEVATARPTLERALLIVTGFTRLSPIDAELECLQRASLDLRNGLGLAADASVCLPKAWDVKDPLRDL